MHIFDFISRMVYNYIMPITFLDSASTSEQSEHICFKINVIYQYAQVGYQNTIGYSPKIITSTSNKIR